MRTTWGFVDYTPQINRGMDFLDRAEGRGNWEWKIDLDTLNISSMTQCVLGQVYGHYKIGLTRMFEVQFPRDWAMGLSTNASAHGFILPRYGQSFLNAQGWRRKTVQALLALATASLYLMVLMHLETRQPEIQWRRALTARLAELEAEKTVLKAKAFGLAA